MIVFSDVIEFRRKYERLMCLLAAPWVQLSVSTGDGWPHNALRHHWLMPISCHFRDYKALLVTRLTHIIGAIASVQTFTFTFTFYLTSPGSAHGSSPLPRRLIHGCSAHHRARCSGTLFPRSFVTQPSPSTSSDNP